MFQVLAVLAFSGAALAQRNPNPCLGVVGSATFVNDFTSCQAYFWCDGPIAFPAGPCETGFNFDEERQACSTDAAVCLPCPGNGTLAVGVATDVSCTQYEFCIGEARDSAVTFTCGAGLRFNRVTGVCDDAANVLCPGGGDPVGVDEGCRIDGELITGDVNSQTACNEFIQCVNGVPGTDIFTCGTLHFNPVTRICDLPERVIPPCIEAAHSGTKKPHYIPSAPHIQSKTFRERLRKRLHL